MPLSLPLPLLSPDFGLAALQVALIDLVLSGDNAVVIALACRNLPPEQRRRGIVLGTLGAVVLRIALSALAAALLHLPGLELVGGLLLLWIGVKLLAEEEEAAEIAPSAHLWGAVRVIVVADLVMSLDNVVGVAGAAHGDLRLLFFGLLLSIPLIVWSSQLLLRLMQRWPLIAPLGAGLLGWVGGDMVWADPLLRPSLADLPDWSGTAAAALAALSVVGAGRALARRERRDEAGADD